MLDVLDAGSGAAVLVSTASTSDQSSAAVVNKSVLGPATPALEHVNVNSSAPPNVFLVFLRNLNIV